MKLNDGRFLVLSTFLLLTAFMSRFSRVVADHVINLFHAPEKIEKSGAMGRVPDTGGRVQASGLTQH